MEVLSGGAGSDRPPPPPGRRYLRRQSSLKLSASDMFLFRSPTPTYVATSWPGELCVLGSSVCLALERAGGASRVLLFCHGTSSDIGMSRRSLETLRDGLGCHVVGVEYPGYGLTAHGESNEESVNAAVRVAFLHITEVMGWPANRVIVMGRSLGSGPAARLAREFQPGALFLLAAFTGVGDIAGSIVGETLASMFNLNQWNNKEEVAGTTSPTLILHGLKDKVVPHTHSLDLYRASAAAKKYVGLLLESDHNRINWKVVCQEYAKPFMEMACPEERDRMLGVQLSDVQKLANFDPSGSAALILACARAAWARRREEGNEHGGAPSFPASAAESSSPNAHESRARPALSALSTSVLSVSPGARRETGDRAAALPAAASGSAATVEQRLGGGGPGGRSPGLLPVGPETDERSSSGDGGTEARRRMIRAPAATAAAETTSGSDDGRGQRCRNRDDAGGKGVDAGADRSASRRIGQDGGVDVAGDAQRARALGEKEVPDEVEKGDFERKTNARARRARGGSGWRRLSALFSGRGSDA
ncbi:unnamed protein product [Scytosiphon promiscuus]